MRYPLYALLFSISLLLFSCDFNSEKKEQESSEIENQTEKEEKEKETEPTYEVDQAQLEKEGPAIKKVIIDNLEAMEMEDIEAAMKTVDKRSPGYASSSTNIPNLFEKYDLDYSLNDMKIIAFRGDSAFVDFTQTTKKIGGPGLYRDNESMGTHLLRKHEGAWLIFGTKLNNVNYLDQK